MRCDSLWIGVRRRREDLQVLRVPSAYVGGRLVEPKRGSMPLITRKGVYWRAVAPVFTFAVTLTLGVVLAGCGGSGSGAKTIDIPDDLVAAFQSGAPNGEYVFYALADKVPDWKSVAGAGITICSESRPPLIPQKERGIIDSGSIASGTEVTLNTSDVTDVLGIKRLIVTVPAAVNGCTEEALKSMSDTPGMLLLTDAKASFPEKGQLVKVVLK